MSTEFKREERYIVFKVSDLGNSLKGDEIRKLAREYAEHRKQQGKKPLDCVVVEKDWPEYEPTWQAIEARVTGAQAQLAPGAPEGWKLVPIKPTEEMINKVIYERLDALMSGRDHSILDIYHAMIEVAPEVKSCI